jgi:hypothetical protein
MADLDHNKVLADVARDALRPLGFRRKGRSRLWFEDRGWWVVLVEFQSSQWDRGSYLNVAPMWLWKPGGSRLHPDVAGRIADFARAENEDQFRAAARRLANIAVDESTRLQQMIVDPASAAAFIEDVAAQSRATHPDLNAGIAHGLASDWEQAERLLDAFATRAAGFSDPGELAAWGHTLLACVGRPDFEETVRSAVQERRAQLDLEGSAISFTAKDRP